MQPSFSPLSSQHLQTLALRFQAGKPSAEQKAVPALENHSEDWAEIPASTAKAYGLGRVQFGRWGRNQAFDTMFQYLLDNAARATHWSLEATEHGERIRCQLDGKTYECKVVHLGNAGYSTELRINEERERKNGNGSFDQLFQIAAPILAERYQLGNKLALTPFLQKITRQLPHCEVIPNPPSDTRDAFPSRQHSVQILLPDGEQTRVTIIQGHRGEAYLSIEKPESPVQLLSVLPKDKDALRLLAETLNESRPGSLDLSLIR